TRVTLSAFVAVNVVVVFTGKPITQSVVSLVRLVIVVRELFCVLISRGGAGVPDLDYWIFAQFLTVPGERRRELTSVAPSSGAARMPRSPRLHVPGACYHVILRGNHREPLRLETVHSLQARQQASINPHTNNPSPVPVQRKRPVTTV